MTPERHAELQELFEAVVNLTEPERAAYLDRACEGDTTLRNRLEELLAADEETAVITNAGLFSSATMECSKCMRCFDRPLTACPHDGAPLEVSFPGPRLVDGKYLAERHLGHGGMGAVYVALHVGLEKRFALKLILQQNALSPMFRENFEREARALGLLDHPNIVGVSDYGVDSRGGGLPYLVMEYLEGIPLSQVLKERQIVPLEKAIDLLRAVADGVDAAHRKGIVHGDLKPSNLVLSETECSSTPVVKIVDFGLARLTTQPTGNDQAADKRTGGGSVRGTPAYMAPELLRGEDATPQSDCFALGVIAYEMLTGQRPFGKTLGEVMAKIKSPPAPPSSINSRLPRDVDAPVLAMLSPKPDDRPAGAATAVSGIAQAWLRAEQRKWRVTQWPKRFALAAVGTCLCALLSAGIMQTRLARVVEDRLADQRFAMLPSTPPDPRLMLLSIDDATLNADPKPLADRADEFANTTERLFANGAAAIGVDLLLPARWSESQEFGRVVAAHADRLALSIMTSPPPGGTIGAECLNRLTAYALGPQKYEALFGIVNLGESDDRAIRRAYWAFNDKAGNRRLSFAARMVEAGVSRREPLNETDPFWIDYSVRPGSLPSVSWNDVSARLAAAPDSFRSKLIIIGATFTASGDVHRIPGPNERGLVAGEYVQALIANTILAGYPIHAIRLLPCLIVTGIFCLASTIGALWFPHRYGISLSASILTFAGYGLGAFLLFRETRTLIPVVGPELLILMALLAGLCFKLGLTQYPTAKS